MTRVGIRIYEHKANGEVYSMRNYNFRHGMQMIRINTRYGFDVCGVGAEGLALAVHFKRSY